jgi:Uma2 family endonuclease
VASQLADAHRFSIADVRSMYDAGILGTEDRVELVDGVVVAMSAPDPRHAGVLEWLAAQLAPAARGRYGVRVQDTFLTADGGYLLPDLIVIEPIPRDRLPQTALLVVEIARGTLARDAGKATAYAAAGVPEYWIVDLDRDEVLVRREPGPTAFASIERFMPGDVVRPLASALPAIDVAALLAP